MTRTTNARLAGATFLLYILAGLAGMALFGQAIKGADGTAAKLARMAEHATTVRMTVLITLFTAACAVVLGVTLYALTRDEDRDLAMMALCCRVSEGVIGAVSTLRTLGLLSIATATAGTAATDAAATNALGALLLRMGGLTAMVSAICFAVGSTLYSYLFLRARSIPISLARLGVFASVLLVIGLPAQLAGLLGGSVTMAIWIPMLVFEVWLALWLLFKGAAAPAATITLSRGGGRSSPEVMP